MGVCGVYSDCGTTHYRTGYPYTAAAARRAALACLFLVRFFRTAGVRVELSKSSAFLHRKINLEGGPDSINKAKKVPMSLNTPPSYLLHLFFQPGEYRSVAMRELPHSTTYEIKKSTHPHPKRCGRRGKSLTANALQFSNNTLLWRYDIFLNTSELGEKSHRYTIAQMWHPYQWIAPLYYFP